MAEIRFNAWESGQINHNLILARINALILAEIKSNAWESGH